MSRYQIKQFNLAEGTFIQRTNVPNFNRVYIQRGFCLSNEKDTIPNSIYLDGAFKGPLFDVKNKIFSLDHHENCIRQITKSTCEQALLFAKSGTFDNCCYQIIGNDPDLDTILASWILLNIDEIKTSEVFSKILPLILVEGNIDSYGFNYEEMTGLSKDVILREKNRIDWLRENEVELKQSGEWNTINFVEYTLSVFEKLDKFVFHNSDKSCIKPKTYEYFPFYNEKNILFVEDERLGIYDVEEICIRDKMNVECIILSNSNGKYSIKLSTLISSFSLKNVWLRLSNAEMLEKIKQGITSETNPQIYFTTWGGSLNIGGSPRYENGRGSYLNNVQVINHVLNELNMQLGFN